MNLLIHDLSDEEWGEVSDKYEGWKVIADEGNIKPCVGCFGCWVKEPGQCVIKDGYEHMGELIHKADEVVIMSKYTYGGFSSFVKNVFDRSIGYVLPYFEIFEGEMHHKKRYPEEKNITFVFRGIDLSDADKQKAKRYVEAVCRNLHSKIKDIVFENEKVLSEEKDFSKEELSNISVVPGSILFINGSLRGERANSKRFLNRIIPDIKGDIGFINLNSYLKNPDELKNKILSAEKVVLGMPLYVDGIPSAPLRMMEMIEKCVTLDEAFGGKKIYVVTNMGLFESKQLVNLLSMVKLWCDKCNFTYGGGLAIGAGEMMTGFMDAKNIDGGPTRNVAAGFRELASAINESKQIEDIYADSNKFPRSLYMLIANSTWPKGIKRNGLKRKDLYRRFD
ncbi:hypothetical protein [uncultured Eubacterium sp.]|uniref:hypothetical protein n=1 Tax=uncultured Eubacterium sp. TaxID=165185 RepID=UPI000E9FD909|nr:hypothetical protein [uncultured Eubacterium sp.]HAV90856.1 hypothetical protein [Eubacterium sp.]